MRCASPPDKRLGAAVQREVVQAHVHQETQAVGHLLRLAQPRPRPADRRPRHHPHGPGDAGRRGRLRAPAGAPRQPGGLPAGAAARGARVRRHHGRGARGSRGDLAGHDGPGRGPLRRSVQSGCRSGSRGALGRRGKSGHRRARVPGNARTGKPDGKRNREQTAPASSDTEARVKRWCKRPPAPAETRAARQAPPGATPSGAMTRPAELQVGGMSRPATTGPDG